MAVRRASTRTESRAHTRTAAKNDSLESLLARARRAAVAGDSATAIPLYIEAISKGCTLPAAFNDLGTLLAQKGEVQAALVQFEIAVALQPAARDMRDNLCKALDMLGAAAFAERRWNDAAVAYTRYVALDDSSAVANTNAGMAWRAVGALDRALPFLRQAAALTPTSAVAHFHLGTLLFQLNQAECEAELLQAAALDPAHVDTQVNLGVVNHRLGRMTTAIAYLNEALRLAPQHVEAIADLAAVLRETGDIESSLAHYRRALDLRSDSAPLFSNYLLTRLCDAGADPITLRQEHEIWNARFAAPVDPGTPSSVTPTTDRDAERRLRVGYVSPDFRNHAVATFVEPLIAAHDRIQFHVTCYSDARPDAVTARIRNVARPEVWRDVRGMSDEALARQIVADGIDVLVDLSGHTADNRLLTFARRPAPVQVTYCGYPGTTGLAAIDWRLTDAVADPPGAADSHCTEALWRMPRGFLCFQANPGFAPVAEAPFQSRGFVTFGSFNNLSKVGDGVLDAWAEILSRVPGAHLLMKSRALSEDEPRQRLRGAFSARGIQPDRVEFARYAGSSEEHVAWYGKVDLALDSFPYNGTTTTCEALWMGVPVVTWTGTAHASRVSASLLTRIGCPELVAGSRESYIELASRLAQATEVLAAYRASLRGKMAASPLTNSEMITRDIEVAYREMWRRWCSLSTSG